MAPSVARESTLHCKLDSQLHRAAIRSNFSFGGKWIMKIPVKAHAATIDAIGKFPGVL